ncbi:MAG: hypothetical protein JOZ29_02775 [Deltaproteobacteria bacterium]|nr:hypothetical protein [Deltaproteobacteria bacterium]MBV8451184.1 hypothetical protein [Deltaproteobacteria bacterium]
MKKKAEVIPLADDPNRPLSSKHASIFIKKLWREGKVTWREHAEGRKKERDFDTLEVETLVLQGTVIGVGGRQDDCWRYEIEDRQRTKRLIVAIRRERIQIITIERLGRP